jgi:hypothetical protein
VVASIAGARLIEVERDAGDAPEVLAGRTIAVRIEAAVRAVVASVLGHDFDHMRRVEQVGRAAKVVPLLGP